MTRTVLIDLSSDFASRARAGDTGALKTIAAEYALELAMLCPRRSACATFYMAGAKACDSDVIAAVRAVDGVVAVTPMRPRT